ncbi:hypothetical protein [Micropruina sp.]|uniref:hypothetical protein n=1 Tax=Micropruina sp. TaxID=2737536 RepID=UPI0039E26298
MLPANRHDLERDALDDALARMDAEHGPVDEVAAIFARLAGRAHLGPGNLRLLSDGHDIRICQDC